MPILNYTTKIEPIQTVGEIQSILAKHGAANISIDYLDGQPIALTFCIYLNQDLINFRLPSNWQGVYKVLSKTTEIPNRYKTQEQARATAWRITKDWVEAQMAIIQSGLATLPEVFLPYAVTQTGQTLYESACSNGMKLLGAKD